MTRASWIRPISVLVVIATAGQIRAQSADAEALFQEGRRLIKAGKLAAGCDKLAASERAETSVGTLLNLGDCREKLGKLASAWAAFRKAEALAKRTHDDGRREAEARKRALKLEPRLVSIVIEVPHRVDGLVVRRDGELLDPGAWNTPLPIDPGTYTIVATAPGYVPWHQAIEVTGKRAVVRVPALERDAPAPEPTWTIPPAQPVKAVVPVKPAPATAPPVLPPPVVVIAQRQESEHGVTESPRDPGVWSTSRRFAAGMSIGGAVGLAAGLYFGLEARDLQGRADERCPRESCSDPYGLQLNADARTAAHRANVMYFTGGVTIAAAAVLWLWGAPPVAPTVGEHHAGVALAGRF